MRRPGIWCANGRPTDVATMLSWQPGALTCFQDYLAPNQVQQYKQQHPEALVIVRFQHPRNWRDNITESARNHANELLAKWPEMRDFVDYVYFANELNLHYENGDEDPGHQWMFETPDFYQSIALWTRLVADAVKSRVPDYPLVMHPFAYGHHEDGAPDDSGNPKDGWAGYDYLAGFDYAAELIQTYFDGILTFHAYWGNAGGSIRERLYDPVESSWHAFRWRRVLDLFKERYNIDARVIIDEAGNFGASDLDFTDQVLYYSKECLMDPRVLALCFFLWQDPTSSPGNLPNSWVQRCYNLSEHVSRLTAMPDVPVVVTQPTEMIRVLVPGGDVVTLELEAYLRGVVPSEMGAEWLEVPNDPADLDGPSLPQLTQMEALSAQAVLARSFAMWRIAHPRHDSFDVYSTTADQVYNRSKLHARSDMAIRDTEGVHLHDAAGRDFKSMYIKACGRADCAWCDGKGGYGGKMWPGRACQLGAQAMALAGAAWREIVLHYYSDDVKFSDDG